MKRERLKGQKRAVIDGAGSGEGEASTAQMEGLPFTRKRTRGMDADNFLDKCRTLVPI